MNMQKVRMPVQHLHHPPWSGTLFQPHPPCPAPLYVPLKHMWEPHVSPAPSLPIHASPSPLLPITSSHLPPSPPTPAHPDQEYMVQRPLCSLMYPDPPQMCTPPSPPHLPYPPTPPPPSVYRPSERGAGYKPYLQPAARHAFEPVQ